MRCAELEEVLRAARSRNEALLYTPPDGYELVPEPGLGAPYPCEELDDTEEGGQEQ